MHRPHLHGPRTLALIAAFKFVKATLLVVLAIALFRLRHPEASAHFGAWLSALPVATGHEFVSRGIDRLLGLSPQTIGAFSLIALVYAALYAIEGFGLWLNARWAQYLTVISTSLFIPVEIWEMVRHFTPMKLLALVINIAIVAYLVWLLRAELGADNDPAQGRTPPSTTRT
jgi:uncharacterized membrane protein (DUF2068 family)